MRRWFLFLLVVLIGVAGIVHPKPSWAQIPEDTIFFYMQGDIWSYTLSTGVVENKTGWGYNYQPVLSPDGTRFAYLSLAKVATDVVRVHPEVFLPDPKPINIWVWEYDLDDAYRLVDQPSNASVSTNGVVENIIMRRSLTWSPDGSQLAWLEYDTVFSIKLVIYDFNTNGQRILPIQVPFPYGDGGAIAEQPLRWGSGGIALMNVAVANNGGADGPTFEQTIYVYEPNTGTLVSQTVVGKNEDTVAEFYWMESGLIGLMYQSGVGALLNSFTGDRVPAQIPTVLYSLVAPNNFSLSPALSTFENVNGFGWRIVLPSGSFAQFNTSAGLEAIAMSPSGSQVAYVDDSLYVYLNEQMIKIPNTQGVNDDYLKGIAWGPTGYRQ